jgi:hypothetical protein
MLSLMKFSFSLFLTLLFITQAHANLRIVPVTEAAQKELGLNFSLLFETLTPKLLLVRFSAEKAGPLKDFQWPSLFLPEGKEALMDVRIGPEPVLTNRYSFLINPGQLPRTRLHLHCMTGGSSEVIYDVDLQSYAAKQGFAESEPMSFDLLPLLTDPKKLDARREQLERLKTAKVQDVAAARNAAIGFHMKHNDGLDARDGSRVVALFALSHDVEGFGKEGDLIWNVKILRFDAEVTNEIWINSVTGEGKAMLVRPGTPTLK